MKTTHKLILAFLLVLTPLLSNKAYAAKYKVVDKVKVFDNEVIQFAPGTIDTSAFVDGQIIKLGNGRLILKKVKLPKLKRDVILTTTVRVESNGDRWDKSGSLFVIPAQSEINMIGVAEGKQVYPDVIKEYVEEFPGIIAQENYLPPVELMRFMTPFGVGFYSKPDSITKERTMPVYIDGWAPHVEWTQDVSDRYPLLTDEVYVGAFIDTWTEDGYKISVDLELKESEVKQDKLVKTEILPIINTVYYQAQGIPDLFNRQDLTATFNIPKGAKNVQLKYIVTGHGGQSGGDEFVENENILSIDNKEIYRFTPWRTDCAAFRRFNPATGTWLKPREVSYIAKEGRGQKQIEEIIASSDLSRSNWCPGSDVQPVTLFLDDIQAGEHSFKVSIPDAQSAANGKLNHWLVSAYLVWEK